MSETEHLLQILIAHFTHSAIRARGATLKVEGLTSDSK